MPIFQQPNTVPDGLLPSAFMCRSSPAVGPDLGLGKGLSLGCVRSCSLLSPPLLPLPPTTLHPSPPTPLVLLQEMKSHFEIRVNQTEGGGEALHKEVT